MIAEKETEALYLGNEISWIETEKIMPNRSQPRTVFDAEGLNELAESIQKYGILQPLTVRELRERSIFSSFQYELVTGERRLRAAKLIGMEKAPCIVIKTDAKTSAELAIIENLHRKDLNIFEEAAAIASLIEIYHMTQEQVAKKLSMTQAGVANKLRLLRLEKHEREQVLTNKLSERHARALLRIKNPSLRQCILSHIVRHSLNVKQTEDYIDQKLSAEKREDKQQEARVIDYKTMLKTIEKAVEYTRNGGARVKTQCSETDSDIIYTISIPK